MNVIEHDFVKILMTTALAEQVSALEAHLAAKDARILDLEVRLALRCGEASFSLQSRELQQVPAALFSLRRLTRLDLSRNALAALPAAIGELAALTALDLSRNVLRQLPAELGRCGRLRELSVLANKLRPVDHAFRRGLAGTDARTCRQAVQAGSLPLRELAAGLRALRVLDLRFNKKLKDAAREAVAAAMPWVHDLRVTVKAAKGGGAAGGGSDGGMWETCGGGVPAADRDATRLRDQLEPISTPQLRRRLRVDFGVPTDPENVGRGGVMAQLLAAYAAEEGGGNGALAGTGVAGQGGQRAAVRRCGGAPLSAELQTELLAALRATVFHEGMQRERHRVRAKSYVTLQRPCSSAAAGAAAAAAAAAAAGGAPPPAAAVVQHTCGTSSKASAKARLAAAKLAKHRHLWDLAARAMAEVDVPFCGVYTHIAITKNFEGSPHIDTQNVGPFYGLALGDFSEGGGALCVECSAREVVEVDTRGRLAKVDGRYVHWVTPYEGERYSIIYYQTEGAVTPMGDAFYPPPRCNNSYEL